MAEIKKMRSIRFNSIDLEKKIIESMRNRNIQFNYRQFADAVISLTNEEMISPVKSSGLNSMFPPIYKRYSKIIIKDTLNANELVFHPKIKINFYKKNGKEFFKVKEKIEAISRYLNSGDETLLTINERSYELFLDEKFLASDDGKRLLTRIGVTIEDLNCEIAYEPFFFYSSMSNDKVENILIVENKDIFYSIKKIMQQGLNTWGDIYFQMVIYGEGNKITRSIDYIEEIGVNKEANIYYFGDFDLEGISIKTRFEQRTDRNIKWMNYFYKKMWRLRDNLKSKKTQRGSKSALNDFLKVFQDTDEIMDVKRYLTTGKYIPQEVVNQKRLKEWAH